MPKSEPNAASTNASVALDEEVKRLDDATTLAYRLAYHNDLNALLSMCDEGRPKRRGKPDPRADAWLAAEAMVVNARTLLNDAFEILTRRQYHLAPDTQY